jgi:hypothetical protein
VQVDSPPLWLGGRVFGEQRGAQSTLKQLLWVDSLPLVA